MRDAIDIVSVRRRNVPEAAGRAPRQLWTIARGIERGTWQVLRMDVENGDRHASENTHVILERALDWSSAAST